MAQKRSCVRRQRVASYVTFKGGRRPRGPWRNVCLCQSSAACRRRLGKQHGNGVAFNRTSPRLEVPSARLVSEQPNYERLARRQRVAMAKLPRYYRHSAGSMFEPGMRAEPLQFSLRCRPTNTSGRGIGQEPRSHGIPSVNKSTGQFGGRHRQRGKLRLRSGQFSFGPQAAEAWVQSASVIRYGIYYVANSHFMTAHTRASINVLVSSTNLAGGDV